MRVFLHRDSRNEYPSVNFAIAAEGFKLMGWELVSYQQIASILADLDKEDIIVDFLDQSRHGLRHLGIEAPVLPTYPHELQRFLGRNIWTSTINTIAATPELWPVFVKPHDETKKFTGVLVREIRDLRGCGDPHHDTAVWCSEPVNFRREWRCFVRYGHILDVRPYTGNWRDQFDPRVIEAAVDAWTEKPHGCALDIGIDDQGRTLVIEANDGFALGAYGLSPRDYARLLSARWTQLTGTKDLCDF